MPLIRGEGGSNMTSICFKWNQIGSHPRGVQALCDVLKAGSAHVQSAMRNGAGISIMDSKWLVYA